MCHLHGATRHPLDRMNVTLGVSRSLAVAGRVFRGQLSIGIGGLGKADAVPSMGPRPTHPGPDGAKGRPGRSAPRRCLTAGLGTSRPLLLPGPGPPASAPLGLGLRAGAEAQSPLSWASARRYRDFSVTTRAWSCNSTSPSPGRSLAATPASRCSVCVRGVCAHTHTHRQPSSGRVSDTLGVTVWCKRAMRTIGDRLVRTRIYRRLGSRI